MEDKDISKDIFYKPDITVKKDYYSSGSFSDRSDSLTSADEATGTREIIKEPEHETDSVEIVLSKNKIDDKTIREITSPKDLLKTLYPEDKISDEKTLFVSPGSESVSEPTILERVYTKAKSNEEKLIRIKPALDVLPEQLKNILEPITDFLYLQQELELNEINQEIIRETQDEEKEINKTYYTGDDESSTTVKHDQDVFIDDEGFTWNQTESSDIDIVMVKAKSIADQAKSQYLLDSTELKELYLIEIEDVLTEYINPLIAYMNDIGIINKEYLDKEYDATCVTGVPLDAQHLSDTIMRNQVITNELLLLMEKTHSKNKMVNLFTSFDLASQQRIRYLTECYNYSIENFTDIKKNDILLNNRQAYEAKYNKCKLNVYKYLNSAAECTREILDYDLNSKAAKCYLLSKNVNIYATKKYEAISLSNSAGVSSSSADNGTAITGSNAAIAKQAAANIR